MLRWSTKSRWYDDMNPSELLKVLTMHLDTQIRIVSKNLPLLPNSEKIVVMDTIVKPAVRLFQDPFAFLKILCDPEKTFSSGEILSGKAGALREIGHEEVEAKKQNAKTLSKALEEMKPQERVQILQELMQKNGLRQNFINPIQQYAGGVAHMGWRAFYKKTYDISPHCYGG